MKIQKININKNQKVLLFDIVPQKNKNRQEGRIIMKMVFLIGKKAAY